MQLLAHLSVDVHIPGVTHIQDSLTRLEDIAKVEAAQRDEKAWAARPREEREQQEGFKRATGGVRWCEAFLKGSC
jgi:hypothetical protein